MIQLNNISEDCWEIVRVLQRSVLIMHDPIIGTQAYLCDNFKPKGRDFFQNEVIGGQNINELLQSMEMHQASGNKYSMETKLETLPRVDFSFGHDNFILLKSIR